MQRTVLFAVVLIAVGVGSVGLVVLGPASGAGQASEYLTATAARTDVIRQAVATGTVSAHATYGLGFGRAATIVTGTAATGSGSGSSGSATWRVTTVDVGVGAMIKTGDRLAAADDSAAALQVEIARASLGAAEAKLADDTAGPTGATKAAAQESIDQAKLQLSSAKKNQSTTLSQNKLSIARAESAYTKAKKKLAADKADGAASAILAADQDAVDAAKSALDSAKVSATASANQAAGSVASATLGVTSAENAYKTKTAGIGAAQIATDEVQVASAKAALESAETALGLASIVAPADGVVVAVNVVAGLDAPSGDAIQVAVGPMEVTASFAEADLPSLALGQAATVTISSLDLGLDGSVTSISPVASSSGTSSVVTYGVVVALTDPPDTVRAGMSAAVAVATASATDVVAVPAISLVGRSGNYAVRVLDASGRVEVRQVEVGLTTSSLAEIRSGIEAGEAVVIGTTAARQNTGTTGAPGGFTAPGGFGGGGFGGGGRGGAGGGGGGQGTGSGQGGNQ